MRLALSLLFTTVFVHSASAQAPRLEVRDPFFAGTELGTRGLSLGGRGFDLELDRGGRVEAALEFTVDCGQRCSPRDPQQVLIGLAGAPEAQACIWQGHGSTNGWLAGRFTLDVPDQQGIYEVRARKTRAKSCAEALRLWGTHRGDDPSIGVIIVDTSNRPERGDRRKRREIAELQRAFDASLLRQEEVQRQLLSLTSLPANGRRAREIQGLVRESITLTTELRLIQTDLRDALEDRNSTNRPRFIRPIVSVVADPDPFPVGMVPHEFDKFARAVDKATFAHHQIQTIKDYLATGVLLSTEQAAFIVRKFMHDGDKVEAAALLCTRIIEPAALPDMLSLFTFESYRQELRERTGNRCGGARP